MLVVRRRVGEGIVVAGDIEIEIVEISRTRVKLGISAPREIGVVRKEAAATARENRTAAAYIAASATSDLLRLLSGVCGEMSKTTDKTADM